MPEEAHANTNSRKLSISLSKSKGKCTLIMRLVAKSTETRYIRNAYKLHAKLVGTCSSRLRRVRTAFFSFLLCI